MRRIGLNEISKFIRHELKRKLKDDLRNHHVLREADIECCAYFHLRRFLSPDSRWRVFARKYSTKTGYYPDLIIYRKHKMRIAMEIKWRRKKISKRDRKKLRNYLKLGAKKVYFLTALPDSDNYTKATKKSGEKHKLFELRVGLGFKGTRKSLKIDEWKKERKLFRV